MSLFFLVCLCFFSTFFQTANSSWWYLCQIERDTVKDPRMLCHIIPNIRRKQKQICIRNPKFIHAIGDGATQGIDECKYQFKFHKWNCTTFEKDPSVFGKFMLRGATRELAFLHAMTSASAAFSLAKACSSGAVRCPCAFHNQKILKRSKNQNIENELHKQGGCQDPLKWAVDFVRRFVNAGEDQARDAKATIYLHNNRVGRITLMESSDSMKTCKCHGLSGSCTYRTCWRPLPNFRDIGSKLRTKYNEAIRIDFNPTGRNMLVNKYQKRPSKFNLIYLEDSPDFCSTDRSKGLLGTANRLCNENSEAEDSCDILCCGRGYESVKIVTNYRCECKFIWCCEVKCKMCQGVLVESYCKSPKKKHRFFKNSTIESSANIMSSDFEHTIVSNKKSGSKRSPRRKAKKS